MTRTFSLPSLKGNAGKVLNVASDEENTEWGAGGGGGDPTIGNPVIGADPNLFLYTDASGNLYQDGFASRDSVTNETIIGYRTGAGQFTNAFYLGNILGGALTDGAVLQRHDSVADTFTLTGTLDRTPFGGTTNTVLSAFADLNNGIFSSHTIDDTVNDLSYNNAVLGIEAQFGVDDTNAYIQHTDNTTYESQIYLQADKIQTRYEDITNNIITKVIVDSNGVELNYQDGIGSNHFYVTDDTATLSTLQDVRDDTGTFTPVNFVYTDGTGKFLSAPLSAISPSYKFYAEKMVSGTPAVVTGANSVSIGNGATCVADTSVSIHGSIGVGADNSNAFGGYIATGAYNSLAMFGGNVNGAQSVAIGGFSQGIASATFGGGGANANGDSSMAFATTGVSYAQGTQSIVLGNNIGAYSYSELTVGKGNTVYTPNSASGWDTQDRLLVVGCSNVDPGSGTNHDAFTILKNRKVGVGYDNFENTVSAAALQVNGYVAQSYGFINATDTLTVSTIKALNKINDSTGNIDITLPDPALLFSNDLSPVFTFKCSSGSSNTVRLLPNSTETIDGASSFTFSNVPGRQSVGVFTDGSNWWII